VQRQPADPNEYVSSGRLPPAAFVASVVEEAYERYRGNREGANAELYPALAGADTDAFGVCVAGTDGALFAAGNAGAPFSIMSVSKPFVFAIVCESLGAWRARELLGANGTGLPFNSLEPVMRGDGRTNPMVNPGAIAASALVPGGDLEQRWLTILDGLSGFAGRPLAIDEETYASVTETNTQNRAIAAALAERGLLSSSPEEAVELYTRQCVVQATATDLAVMGATLADGGVNPLTQARVVDAEVCRYTLAVMTTAGLYETSGDWLYDVGLPGKSGIGGGIVTVSPGKGGLGTYAPPLDAAGNSVKGQLAARFLSRRLGLDLFVSRPA
jgi:glutaminase